MSTLKAYLIPFCRKKIAIGKEGRKIIGPILYVPQKGAIFYESSVMGDVDASAIVPISVDHITYDNIFLSKIQGGIDGEHAGTRSEFDLSTVVKDIEISEEEFNRIIKEIGEAFGKLKELRHDAMKMIWDLEGFFL